MFVTFWLLFENISSYVIHGLHKTKIRWLRSWILSIRNLKNNIFSICAYKNKSIAQQTTFLQNILDYVCKIYNIPCKTIILDSQRTDVQILTHNTLWFKAVGIHYHYLIKHIRIARSRYLFTTDGKLCLQKWLYMFI